MLENKPGAVFKGEVLIPLLFENLRQEKVRLKQYLAVAGGIVVAINSSGKATLINQKGCELLGFPEQEIVGKDWFLNFIPEPLRDELREFFGQLMGEELPAPAYHENAVLTAGGEERLIGWQNSVLRDKDGRITEVLACGEDLTWKKQAELSLQDYQERLRAIFENAPDGLVLIDRVSWKFMMVNPAFCRMLAYSSEELIGSELKELVPAQSRPLALAELSKLAEGKIPAADDLPLKRKDQRLIYTRITALPIAANGKRYLSCIIRDITERKLWLDEMRSLAKFPAENPNPVLRVSPGGIIRYSNPASKFLLKQCNLKPGGVLPADLSSEIKRVFKSGLNREFLLSCGERVYSLILVPMQAEGYLNIYGRDITEKKRAEENLRDSEERYRNLLENLPDAVFTLDLKGNFTFVSPRAEKLTGYSRAGLLALNILELVPPVYHSLLREKLSGVMQERNGEGESLPFELEILSGDKQRVFVEFKLSALRNSGGRITGLHGIARDKTRQKELEKQLFQSQKMEAIGKLAGGIAHDFNNLLTVMLGNLELARQEIGGTHPAADNLNLVSEAGKRATGLVKQLLSFGRPNHQEEKVLALKQVVEETLSFLRSVIPSTIEIETEFNCGSDFVKAEPATLALILTNLSLNARDAMPEGGRLKFSTRLVKAEPNCSSSRADLKPGYYVCLRVSDNGSGMSPEVKEKIFEPFFSTKQREMGTGLGLTMVYSAVKNMEGCLEVESAVGKGTEFSLYFPRVLEALKEEAEAAAVVKGGTEYILLVDDEDMVLELGRKILEQYGYKVLTARNGEEALLRFKEKKPELSLAVVDLLMPGGGGLKVLEEIKKDFSAFPVLIISGCTDKRLIKHILGKADGFLGKPFTAAKFASQVRKLLDCA